MADRIYVVTHKANGTEPRLVRADNKVQALNFVARDMITAEVAGQDALFELAGKGVKIESAVTLQTQLPV